MARQKGCLAGFGSWRVTLHDWQPCVLTADCSSLFLALKLLGTGRYADVGNDALARSAVAWDPTIIFDSEFTTYPKLSQLN